ncbi:MAG: multifunctional oxoglutarate decarboxylase/oxoglutarate dehydrogenase thiamine pyrophosphate-binding subunit/dihydrolipoyllysine-residue succinyltransferase subunit, partial [Solirubrobacterales bacterium]|nr:multifunctional oxoglutarate decarboxylase/oxoglutarate dehydrogenase thiamine pyrophosphate-binding subunit/dihydrolipoyllysine-residue succinyltransferase subunit [Solirubrobacterales bacterium]
MAVESGTVQVVMPAMGDSVAEGTVLEWRKGVGDQIEADETLVEISTDKVDAEVPSPVAGTVVKVLAAEGETVAVGAALAEIATGDASGNGDAAHPAVETPVSGESEPTSPEEELASAVNEAEIVAATEAATGQLIDIVTPTGGESVTEGTILEWAIKVGQTVREGDTVVEISTDKVDMELPAPVTGQLVEILAEEGDTVTVGQTIGRMSAAPAQVVAPQVAPESAETIDGSVTNSAKSAANASPVARRLAAAEGVDLSGVAGTARGGRITKADVIAASGNGATAAPPAAAPAVPPPAAPATEQQLKGSAAVLARYMDQSRSVPTATSFRTIAVTELAGRRTQLKAAGHRVSFTHLIAYAIARVVTEEMPGMAHHFEDREGKPFRIDDGAVNLGLAVDVERKDGTRTLMVPVIRDAGRLSFTEFLDAYNALVEKARTNTLTADDLSGGNISLTNPGGLGTVASVPRLMTGQGTIVATGSIGYPPGLERIGEAIGAQQVMTMTSTYDHRIIQGAESGRFLARLEAYLRGEAGFYERVFGDLGAELPALLPPPAVVAFPGAPAPAAPAAPSLAPDEEMLAAMQAATSLLKAHRTHGHLAARLDPLGREPEGDPALDPEPLGLTPEVMARIPSRILRMYVPGETLAESLPHLRETYCGPIAYEIEHIGSHRQRLWLREAIESGRFRKPLAPDEQKALLKRLTEVDALERFMHKAYLGQKQFSIEGLDMTVPMLDELIQLSATEGAREVVLGMAHRGRLNVLAHNLGRPYDTIFAEFEGTSTLEPITTLPQGGTGDVKYHHGAQGSYQLPSGESVVVRLESNPSHLEYVDPVVAGATRAAQTTRRGPHANRDSNCALPVILHGDAAFPAQGVVAETLNLQALDGYTVGGTIHIIQNNQVGFTTDPDDARSTTWASDLAKGFDVPIIHVNADDVEACISALRLAYAFRQQFGHDVLIDLIGYRRFGHNEADEPAYTQPTMYQVIKKHPPVREIYARQLIERGVVTEEESTEMTDQVWSVLSEAHQRLRSRIEHATEVEHATGEYQLDRTPSPEVKTAVSGDRLSVLGDELLTVPPSFMVHPKLVKQLDQRRESIEQGTGIHWAHAEELAFASLLTEGIPIRLTGQDTERGTFSQRHLVFHDARTGKVWAPIQHLVGATVSFELHNSPLSEYAAL